MARKAGKEESAAATLADVEDDIEHRRHHADPFKARFVTFASVRVQSPVDAHVYVQCHIRAHCGLNYSQAPQPEWAAGLATSTGRDGEADLRDCMAHVAAGSLELQARAELVSRMSQLLLRDADGALKDTEGLTRPRPKPDKPARKGRAAATATAVAGARAGAPVAATGTEAGDAQARARARARASSLLLPVGWRVRAIDVSTPSRCARSRWAHSPRTSTASRSPTTSSGLPAATRSSLVARRRPLHTARATWQCP